MGKSGIRFKQTGTLYAPTLNSDGQIALGAGTTVSCAFWTTRTNRFISQIGEVKLSDAFAFVPSGTSVAVRNRLDIGGSRYEIISVHEAHNDLGQTDHYGLALQLVSG